MSRKTFQQINLALNKKELGIQKNSFIVYTKLYCLQLLKQHHL